MHPVNGSLAIELHFIQVAMERGKEERKEDEDEEEDE